MAIIKGFLTYTTLLTNAPTQVSPVGELSPIAKTFAKEIGFYKIDAIDDTLLNTFVVKDNANNLTTVPNAVASTIITIGHYILDKVVNDVGWSTPALCAQDVSGQFSSAVNAFGIGAFVVMGSNHFPEWISFDTIDSGVTYHVKVWLADLSFRTQFKDFEIVVIPPVTTVDNLFGSYTAVYNAMQNRTIDNITQDAQTFSNGYPYTRFTTRSFDWVNTANTAQKVPTVWGFLIYGEGGNNEDNIRNAASEYILAHSTHTLTQWKVILPSLFVSTEVIVTPFWTKVAIAQVLSQSGLYSSIIAPADIETTAFLTKGSYTDAHTRANMQVSVFTYKTLAFVAIGSAENVDGKITLKQRFPDYLPINPQSTDFQRMAPATQSWANAMNAMLPIAETLDEVTDVPNDMTVLTRSGIKFLTKRVDNVLYLIAAKSNFV